MRALAVVSLLLLAGCLGGGNVPTPETNTTTPDMASAALPAPIEDSQTVSASADPTNTAMPVCSAPTQGCVHYPFTLNRTANITADLSWTLPASDFDFYVMQEGATVITGANDPTQAQTGTSEHMEGELEAGDYEIVVVPWAVTQDTYTLAATFS